MRAALAMLTFAIVAGITGQSARAADQTILGDTLQLKNPGTPDKRKVVAKAKEKASSNTLQGNPTMIGGGATLTIRANGGTPSSQAFSLPQGTDPTSGRSFWSGTAARGFTYRDSKGAQGPIRGVQIKRTGAGIFSIKASGSGKFAGIFVLPPDPGTDGCLLLEITGGDSYSAKFGALDGVITNKAGREYKHKRPTLEGTCVTTTTTSITTSTTTTSSTTTSSTTTSSTSTSSTSTPTTTSTSTSTSSTTSTSTSSTSTSTSTSTTTTTLQPIVGPSFPPDCGTVDVSFSGAPSPGDAGGRSISFTNFVPDTTWLQLYWGPNSTALPKAGLDGTAHALTFSGISGTTATWAGTSSWTDPSTGTPHSNVPIEMRIAVTLLGPTPWVLSTSVPGLDPGPGTGIGAVVDDSAAAAFTANVQFVADIPTDGSGNFIALNAVPTGGQTTSTFTGAFYSTCAAPSTTTTTSTTTSSSTTSSTSTSSSTTSSTSTSSSTTSSTSTSSTSTTSTTTPSTTTTSTSTPSTTTSSTTTSSSTTSSTSTSSTTTTSTSTSTTTTTLPPIVGPAVPPNGGTVSSSFSGAASAGDAGGRNVSFTSFVPNTSWLQLYWGPNSTALPGAGLDGTAHALTFSGISGTTATWAGTSSWTNPSTGITHSNVPIQMRITITLLGPTPWVLSTSVPGLDPGPGTGIGAVVDDSASAADFTANVQFVADIPTDGTGNFIALNAVQTGGQTRSTFTGAFYSQTP